MYYILIDISCRYNIRYLMGFNLRRTGFKNFELKKIILSKQNYIFYYLHYIIDIIINVRYDCSSKMKWSNISKFFN